MALVVLAGGAAALIAAMKDSDKGVETLPNMMGEVRRGPMTISISERASVEAERKKAITNGLQWAVTIKHVVPDGTLVQEGDLIIEFECKELEDAISRQKLDLISAESSLTDATEKLNMTKEQTANKVAKAQAAVLEAKANRDRYIEGEWPVKKNEAESQVTLASKDLALVQQDLDFMKQANELPELKDNKPYSAKQLEAKQLEVDRAKLSLEKARSSLQMLIEYDDPKERRRLDMAVRDADLDLKIAVIEEKSELRMAEGSLQSAQIRRDSTKAELDKMLEDYALMTTKADRAGLVIYKTTRNHWEQSNVVVAVGEKINPRQQLMIIPDMTSIMIRTKVGESIVTQVRPGLEAYVRLDALPNQLFNGRIARVNPVADPQNRWDGNERTYTVMIEIDPGQALDLKPDMTGKAEIILARIEDTTYCPIAAVFTERRQTYAWRLSGGDWQQSPVKVGRLNDSHAEILEGLAMGDVVRLAPPPGYKVQDEQGDAQTEQEQQQPPQPEQVNGMADGPAPAAGAPPADAANGAPRRPRPANGEASGNRPSSGGAPDASDAPRPRRQAAAGAERPSPAGEGS